ncbi:unnamed protein product [Ixodes persulcatus]
MQAQQVLKYQRVGSYYAGTHFPVEILRPALSYQHQPGDVFIVTYPNSGTTWMQCILYQIYTNAAPITSIKDFAEQLPFLERTGGEGLSDLPRPGSAIKTHMLYDRDRVSQKAKYIYIARNPYDVCVSFFNHYKHLPVYQFEDGIRLSGSLSSSCAAKSTSGTTLTTCSPGTNIVTTLTSSL